MFDIGFAELVVLAVIALLVLGPERLPSAVRMAGLWVGRMRRSFNEVRAELERELNTTELKQDRHNDSVMRQLDEVSHELSDNLDEVRGSLKNLEFNLNPESSENGETDKTRTKADPPDPNREPQ